ncbi:MAG TPA: hypothetical protein VET85_16070 [Stellaceae bacterium]|nr:hypothetical protein [Stellaceae bacterium]
MLTMPISRISVLLEQASEVEIAPEGEAPEGEEMIRAEDESDIRKDDLADAPSFRKLTPLLGGLTSAEVEGLLAVALIGDSDSADMSWDTAVRRAQSLADGDAPNELLHYLVLTDAIDVGLGRLGYRLNEFRAAEPSDEEAVEEEEEDSQSDVTVEI